MNILREVIFWIGILFLLVLGFGYQINDFSGAFFFTTVLFPVLMGVSYLFSERLIPAFLLKKKVLKFTLYSIYTLIISLNLTMLIMIFAYSVLANYRYANMLPASRDVFILALIILVIALAKSWWKLLIKFFNQESSIAELKQKEEWISRGNLHIRVERKEVRLPFNEITYIESLADYLKVYSLNRSGLITREKISAISQRLPANFIRIHRSFIVNADLLSSFTSETVEVNKQTLPIGRKFRSNIKNALQGGR